MLNSQKWHGLNRLLSYLRQHPERLTARFVCIVLTNFFLLATPRVMGYAVDRLNESVTHEKLATYGASLLDSPFAKAFSGFSCAASSSVCRVTSSTRFGIIYSNI